MKSFTQLKNEFLDDVGNTDTATSNFAATKINDGYARFMSKYRFLDGTFTFNTVNGTNTYQLPNDMDMIRDVTVKIGSITYTLAALPSRDAWDKINVINFSSAWPQYYYIWGNQIMFFPIPAQTGTATINYTKKYRPLSVNDTTATLTFTNGSTTVTGATIPTTQNMWIVVGVDWYPLVNGALALPWAGATGAQSATISEAQILPEHHDIPLMWALYQWYLLRMKDTETAQMYLKEYDYGKKILDSKYSNRSGSILVPDQVGFINPNVYPQAT